MTGRCQVSASRQRWQAAIACFAAVSAVVLAGCGSDARRTADTDSETTVKVPPRHESLDPLHPVVEIDTNRGAIRVKLDAVNAPGTVQNFLNCVTDGFYANTLFHYVDPGKMIVGGGYSVDFQIKPVGMSIRNEAHNGRKNVRGTIAMARDASAGVDTATSQFFINLADSPSFDHRGEGPDEYGYCVFGDVVRGLDVADEISRSPTRDQGGDLAQTPAPPVVVRSMEVVQ